MRIIGPDTLTFGVDDLNACHEFLVDYGLEPLEKDRIGGYYEALDGTGIEICERDDPSLPAPLPTSTQLRLTTYGVEDQQTLDEIQEEMEKDREVTVNADGSIDFRDDLDFALRFQITRRRHLELDAEMINSPYAPPGRKPNELGVDDAFACQPRILSHVVYFVPDQERAANFYINRLKFVITDKFSKTGPFMRPQANRDHHTLFLIQTPEYMKGLEHFAFHMKGPTELMMAGTRMTEKGYTTFWGPGRHKFGSNWFWYFKSPMGANIEYDADMDQHDGEWTYREVDIAPGTSQVFLFQHRDKWIPMGGPPKGKGEGKPGAKPGDKPAAKPTDVPSSAPANEPAE
ncbi:MAG: VOC family protein [Pseudomonadota bacterium]